MGKTQVAIELAYRKREWNTRCSVFPIPCTSYTSVEQAYMGITQTLGMQEVERAAIKKHVKAYFNHNKDQKWLLIFEQRG